MTEDHDKPCEETSFKQFLREREQYQRYADTWFPGRKQTDQDNVKWINEKICVQYFQNEKLEFAGAIHKLDDDPPDVGIRIDCETLLGVEVTELVNTDTIIENIPYYKNGRKLHDWRYTNYYSRDGEKLFLEQLSELISKKDRKFEKRTSSVEFDRKVLLVVSDESFLRKELVEKFLLSSDFSSAQFDEVYLMLSYHPRLDQKGNYPVFKIC